MPRYKAAVRFFLVGMVLVAVGAAAALVVDYIATTSSAPPIATPDVPE